MKKCSKCQEWKGVGCFYKNRAMKDGLESYCKECSKFKGKIWYFNNKHKKVYDRASKKEYNKKYYAENKEALAEKKRVAGQSLNAKFRSYKNSAAVRGIAFLISIEDFGEFWNSPCRYCDTNINGIGLDRIDSSAGYVLENICSCCEICNRAKLNLDLDSWFEYLEQLGNFQNGGEPLRLQENFRKGKKDGSTKFAKYKYRSKRIGLGFDLSKEYFEKIKSAPCAYCGRITPNMGVDRVNNLVGYLEENCVPCCKNCNSGKRNNSLEAFMKWIGRIKQKYGKKYP